MRRPWHWWDGYSSPERKLWLRWVAATALSLALGSALAEVVGSVVAAESALRNLIFNLRWQIPVGLCIGVPTVVAQYLVLRTRVPEASRWLTTTLPGAAIGAAVGGFAGYAAAMVLILLSFACQVLPSASCLEGVFFVLFPVAGGVAGAVTGGAMGVLLKTGPWDWSDEWTGPLAGAWTATGAVFWALAIAFMGDGGLVDAKATLASGLSLGAIGFASGAVGASVSAGHLVRVARNPSVRRPSVVWPDFFTQKGPVD